MIPDVFQNIKDPGLGLLPGAISGLSLKIGVSSGVVTALLLASYANISDAQDALGQGTLAEATAWHLATGGGVVLAMRAASSVAGTRSAVAPKAGNTGTGVLTLDADPAVLQPSDFYAVVVQISRGVTGIPLATGAYRVSLDGGATFSDEVSAATPYVIPGSGLRLTFAPGATGNSLVTEDSFTATATPAAMNAVDLQAALDAALASPREYEFIHIVGSITPAIAAAVAVKMAGAEANYRYTHTVLEARRPLPGETRAQYDAALLTEYAGVQSARLSVVGDYDGVPLPSALTGRTTRRSAAWSYVSRLSAIPISESPARVASGALPGLLPETLGRNEAATPGLDAGRFTTLRTFIGLSGVYVTNGRMMSSALSDFRYVETRRVMDVACRVSRNAALTFLNESVAVDTVTGFILETEARRIEAFIEAALGAALVSANHVSGLTVSVKRDNNILADGTLYVTVGIIPKGYARMIYVTLGFRNPANEPKTPPPAPAPAPQ